MMTEDANQEDEEHQEENGPHNQLAKAGHAALELGLGRTSGQTCGNIAKGSVATRGCDECGSRAAHDRGAKKDFIMRFSEILGGDLEIIRGFLNRLRFTGQFRLLYLQIAGLHRACIGREDTFRWVEVG